MLDKLVGPADAHHRRCESERVQFFQDGAAEAAAQDVILHGDDRIHGAGVKLQHGGVDGLGEARVDDGGGNAFAFELGGDFLRHGNERAQRKDGHAVVLAVLQQFGRADGNRARDIFHRCARSDAARIAHGNRSFVLHARSEWLAGRP